MEPISFLLAASCMASTLYAEARGEGIIGQFSIAEVIFNRTSRLGTGNGEKEVNRICLEINKPNQFAHEVKNPKSEEYVSCLKVSIQFLLHPTNYTKGATFFYAPS